jgi:hypothetical protein
MVSSFMKIGRQVSVIIFSTLSFQTQNLSVSMPVLTPFILDITAYFQRDSLSLSIIVYIIRKSRSKLFWIAAGVPHGREIDFRVFEPGHSADRQKQRLLNARR